MNKECLTESLEESLLTFSHLATLREVCVDARLLDWEKEAVKLLDQHHKGVGRRCPRSLSLIQKAFLMRCTAALDTVTEGTPCLTVCYSLSLSTGDWWQGPDAAAQWCHNEIHGTEAGPGTQTLSSHREAETDQTIEEGGAPLTLATNTSSPGM